MHSSTAPQKDFSVAIIGGGIGGLTLAAALQQASVPFRIFESAPAFAEIGAGISIGPNAQTALQRLGLYSDFLQFADVPSSSSRKLFFQWRHAEGEEQKLLAETCCKKFGSASIHRAQLLDTFVKRVPKEKCSFGKRVKHIQQLGGEEEARVQISFEDGSTHEADLVIGCDGIHSKVRGSLDSSKSGPSAVSGSSKLIWSGSWAYRGMITRTKFIEALGQEKGEFYADNSQMFLAKDSHLLIFPIQGGQTVNLVAFKTDRSHWPERTSFPKDEPWIQETTQEAMLADFEGYSSDLQKMLKCIDKPSKWALHQLSPVLTSYVNKRVVVMGDAAHGGVPHQGAMAGQAIEDAHFLAGLLSHEKVNRGNLEKALEVYDVVRVPRANRVLETSLEAGDTYEFRGVGENDEEELGRDLETRFDHIWDYDLEEENQRMEEWILENL